MNKIKRHPQRPSTYPEFTQQELLDQAKINAPIMMKYQNLLKLGSGSPEGKGKGRRTYYSQDQIDIYKKVRWLRLAEISYGEIKEFWDLEQKINNYPLKGLVEFTDDGQPIEVSDMNLFFSNVSASIPYEWRNLKNLEPLVMRYLGLKERIKKQARRFTKALRDLADSMEIDDGIRVHG